MKWKHLWASLQQDPQFDWESLRNFCESNPWDPNESQDLSDRIANDILTFEGNRIKLLKTVVNSIEPGRMLLDHFSLLCSILVQPNELSTIEDVCYIAKHCFTAHIDPTSPYQNRLTEAARRFLQSFVKETNQRWTAFENIAHRQSIFHDQIALDPIHIPRLEYVIFSFGMSKPLIFYDLLTELGTDPSTRLHCFTLLKMFLILEDAPTYYLIDSDLYKTVIKSAVYDTDVSVFLTAITILTILLPIVAIKAVKHLDNLCWVLIKAIEWELSWPFILNKCQPLQSEEKCVDELLVNHSLTSVKFCIDQFFTVLYGMFPCNVLDRLSKSLKNKVEPPENRDGFVTVKDILLEYRNLAIGNMSDDRKQYSSRIQTLLESHKCHFQSIISDIDLERQQPWFVNYEASEIIVSCFALCCDQEQSTNQDTALFPKDFHSLEQVSSTVLRINTFLYGPTFQSHLPDQNTVISDQLDPVILLKVFYIILINEGFFKECMRQYHIMHIRKLRKQIITRHFDTANNQVSLYQHDSMDAEFKNIQKISDSLKLQLDASNQRHIQTESMLKQKIADLLVELDRQAHKVIEDQIVIKDMESQIQGLKVKLNENNESLLSHEVKLRDVLPYVEKAKLLEFEVSNLRQKQSILTAPDCTGEAEEFRRIVQSLTTERDELQKLCECHLEKLARYQDIDSQNQQLKDTLGAKAKEFESLAQTSKLEMKALQQKLETLEKINLHLQFLRKRHLWNKESLITPKFLLQTMLIVTLVTNVFCYGRIGHSLSGMIANELLTPEGKVLVQKFLPYTKLPEACSWADSIKSDHKWDWSKPLHYINPVLDDPPQKCVYRPGPEDCPNDICVTESIKNYTSRLISKLDADPAESFKFLIHFIGDLHQPLHTSGRMRGGTQALVRFDKKKRIRSDFKSSSMLYVQFLVQSIGTRWRAEVPEWLSCENVVRFNIQEASTNVLQKQEAWKICPESIIDSLEWTAEMSALNCATVWTGYKRKYEIGGKYYEDNIKIAEKFLAKAGVRMAHVINHLATVYN